MNLFFELIQVAIGNRSQLSSTPTMKEWEAIYDLSKKQALLGIAFSGIERLPLQQRPIIDLTYPWSEDVKAIEANNQQVRKRTAQLLRHLERDDFHAFVLKGQSYGQYYPSELQNRRTAGDIDVWLWPKEVKRNKENGKMESDQETVIRYCLNLLPNQHVCYIHVDFPVFSDIPVEAHFRPSFLCNPFKNRQLQQWYETQKQTVLSSDPTQFRRIFCELHLFKHLFETGFGMRQLLDYYILSKQQPEQQSLPPFLSQQFHDALNQLVIYLFESDPGTPHSPECEFLLQEVLLGGNFGQYDPRIKHTSSATAFAWEKLKHNFRLLLHYPSEVCWEPLFRLYHWYWRQKNT